MRSLLISAALLGAAVTLGGCVYPYGPYGPYEQGPPPGAYGPPPGSEEGGPPPEQGSGPPPQEQGYGPPPQGQGYGPPPQGQGYGAPSGDQGYAGAPPAVPYGYSARWCANHPHKCRRLLRPQEQGAYPPG